MRVAPRVAAKGQWHRNGVLVADEKEANTLYNKGAYGTPQPGGALLLDLAEALYLLENNRLTIPGEDTRSVLRHASGEEKDFELRYIVYRDLRARTFVVKPSNLTDYNVFPRGSLPGRAASTHLVRCESERGSLDAEGVVAEVARATKHGKALLLALVDEEGDLTYYEARVEALAADAPRVPAKTARAVLLADRVLVLDASDAKALFADGWFGRDIGIGLQLSLPEAAYLAEEKRLIVEDADGARLHAADLIARAVKLEPDVELRGQVYRHLRTKGVVVKTGFKYGTHFRAYVGPPEEEHAPYLVHAVAPGRRIPWPEVAGFVRLAHGVRKRLFFAVPSADGFSLLELARRKP